MTKHDPKDTRTLARRLEAWLSAEAADADVRAEAALTALLAWLPEEAPSAAFAQRVLVSVRQESAGSRSMRWLLRTAAVVGLLLVGTTLVAVPSLLLALPASVGAMISAVAATLAALAGWLGRAQAVWEGIGAIAGKAALVLSTPEATLAVLTASVVGAVAFRLLYGLTMLDRRTVHVDSL